MAAASATSDYPRANGTGGANWTSGDRALLLGLIAFALLRTASLFASPLELIDNDGKGSQPKLVLKASRIGARQGAKGWKRWDLGNISVHFGWGSFGPMMQAWWMQGWLGLACHHRQAVLLVPRSVGCSLRRA